mgnify:CR=1 FL=1
MSFLKTKEMKLTGKAQEQFRKWYIDVYSQQNGGRGFQSFFCIFEIS